MTRLVIAIAIVALVAVAALIARRRQAPDAPTQRNYSVPEQVDRADFPHPDTPWLVAVFTSDVCDRCSDVWSKAQVVASDQVAVTEAEFVRDRAIHDKYRIDAVPTTVIVDADGTVWFLEVNVAPGMTETSLMPQSIAAAGLSVGEVLAGIIETQA